MPAHTLLYRGPTAGRQTVLKVDKHLYSQRREKCQESLSGAQSRLFIHSSLKELSLLSQHVANFMMVPFLNIKQQVLLGRTVKKRQSIRRGMEKGNA